MKRYRIFVSGVQKELESERRAIKDSILNDDLLSEYFDVFLFEDVCAKSKSAESLYLNKVADSDIYIGILGQQYGSVSKGDISPVEKEFRAAKSAHKTILIYLKGKHSTDDKKRDLRIQGLIKEIGDAKEGFIRRRFEGLQELVHLVHASLVDFLKEEGIIGRGAFDERICGESKLSDIDESKIRWFLKIAKAARKYPLKEDASAKDVLTHLDLIKGGRLTNAALLLFGKNPNKFFKQAEVKCLQLPGTVVQKPFINYQIYNGNLFEQIDKAIGFVLDAIKFPVIQKSGSSRFERPFEIPEFAIQEAIVNAVTHRNYNNTSGVQVMVFADRVEVWNSGSLPAALTVDDLKQPHTSFPANPFLANVLYLADYAQKAGSGTIEMVAQCKAQHVPEPEFVLIRNKEFRAILPRDYLTEQTLGRMGLNERQMQAVKLIKEKGSISLSDLKAIYPRVVDRTLSRDLQALVRKTVLKTQGDKKGRRYRI
jgi:ATP-dependent DNA helicase RecG